jgi:transposase-like protein
VHSRPERGTLVVNGSGSDGTRWPEHSPAFKAKVALTAINGEKTLADIGEQFDVHPNQITPWRKPLLERRFRTRWCGHS